MRLLLISLTLLFVIPLSAQKQKRSEKAHKKKLHRKYKKNFEKDFKTKKYGTKESQYIVNRDGKRRKRFDKYFQIQGALFYEAQGETLYYGFNMLNLSLNKYNNRSYRSFELELLKFRQEEVLEYFELTPLDTTAFIVDGFNRIRQSAELIYGHSFFLSKNKNSGFFIGPTASLFLNSDINEPVISNKFPIRDLCICAGLGFKAGYNWPISDKIVMNISTRLTLLDVGYLRTILDNPSWPDRFRISSGFHTAFLRSQFPIMIGIRFQI